MEGKIEVQSYNPRKPALFHIKLFQMCEAESGYILGFKVYTGKNSCSDEATTLNPHCTATTKTVMTLVSETNLLDKGHCFFLTTTTHPLN